MSGLPTGTVTFLFADAEGSTDLLQRLGDEQYKHLLDRLRQNLRSVFTSHGGTDVDSRGEEFFVAFPGARDALIAAIDAQRRVALIHRDGASVRLRIGLHTGEPVSTETGYVGIDVHRAARICAAGHGGQILVSQRTSDLLKDDLPPEIGLIDLREHRLKDLLQPEQLYQVVAPDLQDSFPPLRTLSVLRNNLPFQLTSFVGRVREMDEIKQLLVRHRLVTLTGIGGCGKTRLALQVAADLIETFPHGVWLIDLNAITSGELVLPAVVATLQLREQPGRMLELTLVDFLRDKHLLLVLDNCEHLRDACADVAHTLLRRALNLRILATSRERLRVHGEQRYEVPPLELPNITAAPSAEQLTASEAVQLFVERAILGQHRFALTDRNARSVAQIVARLDGIPLAIELAAAKVKLLSTAQIAERLDDRFGLLADGTPIGRQRTLRAMMDWSYELLPESERLVLRRLSVFAGGFTLEATEAIIPGVEIGRHDVLDLLGRLVDKSLVVADRMREGRRYRLLDTVRAYAKDKLQAAGEVGPLHKVHHDWFLGVAERVERTPSTMEDAWMDRLEMDHDNFRTALEWSVVKGQSEAAMRLAVAMLPFWEVRGYWTEGRRWLDATLAMKGSVNPLLKAAASYAAGQLAQYQGDYERTEAIATESLAFYRDLGERRGIAQALGLLAKVCYYRNDYSEAQRLLAEGLEHARSIEDLHQVASILIGLATIALHGEEHNQAILLAQESLDAFRRIGDRRGAAFTLNLLGVMASEREEFDAAQRLFEESLTVRKELGDRRGIAGSLSNLGLIARHQNDYDRADTLYRESLAIRRDLGDRHGMGITLAGLGMVAVVRGDVKAAAAALKESLQIRVAQKDADGVVECLEALSRIVGDPASAARLLGASAALRPTKTRHGLPTPSDEGHTLAVRKMLGARSFQAAWREGEAMTLDQAGAYALALRIV